MSWSGCLGLLGIWEAGIFGFSCMQKVARVYLRADMVVIELAGLLGGLLSWRG
ncbi:hypothetical protein PITCH_A2360004 [uncultured Desulfobacterium sp.]|uniref:Uncharacterized protein n=1 Tax=uncultured Desulfobacterium sp. TaxID=201089 RepID=A0A445MYH0_9BACT|nr:hypothetical protein PITCH_A2360004 [uncultured Desulfobacterium sp.]